jgi:uncharacterized membrane protein YgcG
MLSTPRWLVPAVLVGCLGLAHPARAEKEAFAFKVKDGAKLFSKEAVEKANKKIEEVKRDYKKDLLIETAAAAPADKKSDEGFTRWAAERYREEDVRGVYVLICKDPPKFRIRVGERTSAKGFPRADRGRLEDKLKARLKAREFDAALLDTVNFVAERLDSNLGKVKAGAGSAPKARADERKGGGMGLLGWVCVGLVVLLGLWLLFGLIRAFTLPRLESRRPATKFTLSSKAASNSRALSRAFSLSSSLSRSARGKPFSFVR